MKDRFLAALALLWLLLVAGCGGGAAMAPAAPGAAGAAMPSEAEGFGYGPDDAKLAVRESDALAQVAPAPPPSPAATAAPTPVAKPEAAPVVTDAPTVAGPLLIYTANLTMGVFETVKAIDAVEQLARDRHGYLVIRNDESITIRVPADQFATVLQSVMQLGDVLGRNVEVRDVTEEYFDLQTRLRNQEAVLERLKQLLHKAEKVEDALRVEAELARVATEVESLKGRLKLLRELIAYSTITITFSSQASEQIGSKVSLPFDWLGTLGLGNLLSL